MSFDRTEHSGNAVATTLLADITSGDMSLTLSDASGWPTGSVGPFWLTIDAGLATEEKIVATSRSATTLSGLFRGSDNTSPSAHSAGAAIVHSWTAVEADEANQVVAATLGSVVAKGDSLWATGPNTLARVAAGSDGAIIKFSSSQPAGVEMGFADENNIATSVWGAGLSGSTGTPVTLSVDDTTIELNGSDQAQVKDASIDSTKIGTGVKPVPYQGAVTGGPTSGATELTLATLTVPVQPFAYTLECSGYWTGVNSDADDSFEARIKVDGVEKGLVGNRHRGGASQRMDYAIPTTTFVTIAANTTCAVTFTIKRLSGTGTMSEGSAGLVTARVYY